MRKSYLLPRSVLEEIQVGQLLKNNDAEGRVFGRVKRVTGRHNSWVRVWVDPADTTDLPSPSA